MRLLFKSAAQNGTWMKTAISCKPQAASHRGKGSTKLYLLEAYSLKLAALIINHINYNKRSTHHNETHSFLT